MSTAGHDIRNIAPLVGGFTYFAGHASPKQGARAHRRELTIGCRISQHTDLNAATCSKEDLKLHIDQIRDSAVFACGGTQEELRTEVEIDIFDNRP